MRWPCSRDGGDVAVEWSRLAAVISSSSTGWPIKDLKAMALKGFEIPTPAGLIPSSRAMNTLAANIGRFGLFELKHVFASMANSIFEKRPKPR